VKEKHLDITIRAPYYVLNELTDETENIWLCMHGYGQLAKFFSRKFETLDPDKNFVILPQGLSKFYLQEDHNKGRVGATWMTREDRLTEIENQRKMIETLWQQEVPEVGNRKVIFFGFSQGVATVCRFAAFSKMPFDTLVLWAGGFPHDLPKGEFEYLTGNERLLYFTSRDDPYFSDEVYHQQLNLVKEGMGREPEVIFYEGGHRVMPEVLKAYL